MVVHLVIGTRPQYVKWAAIHQVFSQSFKLTTIDTGQHYDDELTTAFLKDFHLKPPDMNLHVGKGLVGQRISRAMMKLTTIWEKKRPDIVVVMGDTNSTLAGALAAVKSGIPVGHIEAGIRSFNRSMPEETNRVITDHLASLCWCPTKTAVENLRREGIPRDQIVLTGDVMYELLLRYRHLLYRRTNKNTSFVGHPYGVLTIHRSANTTNVRWLQSIFSGISNVKFPIIFPVHPRTRQVMKKAKIDVPRNVVITPPCGYRAFLGMVQDATVVITDSGGVMKEAAWLGVPVVVTREETEWPELVKSGWNILVGANAHHIRRAIRTSKKGEKLIGKTFGDRHTTRRIVQSLRLWFQTYEKKSV